MTKRELDLSVLDEIVRRVVEVAQPERIILSAQRREGRWVETVTSIFLS